MVSKFFSIISDFETPVLRLPKKVIGPEGTWSLALVPVAEVQTAQLYFPQQCHTAD